MPNNYNERRELFDAYTELGEKVKECRDIVQNETTLLFKETIEEWKKISLNVIGNLAVLHIKTKLLLDRDAEGKSRDG